MFKNNVVGGDESSKTRWGHPQLVLQRVRIPLRRCPLAWFALGLSALANRARRKLRKRGQPMPCSLELRPRAVPRGAPANHTSHLASGWLGGGEAGWIVWVALGGEAGSRWVGYADATTTIPHKRHEALGDSANDDHLWCRVCDRTIDCMGAMCFKCPSSSPSGEATRTSHKPAQGPPKAQIDRQRRLVTDGARRALARSSQRGTQQAEMRYAKRAAHVQTLRGATGTTRRGPSQPWRCRWPSGSTAAPATWPGRRRPTSPAAPPSRRSGATANSASAPRGAALWVARAAPGSAVGPNLGQRKARRLGACDK